MSDFQRNYEILESVFSKYGNASENLITILQKVQEIYGYLPKDVIYKVAERLGKTPARVMEVATFYSQFRLEPMGKYLIMICRGTACHVNKSEKVSATVSEYLEIKSGETTPNGLFSLESVACLGCCSLAPVMMINGEVYGRLTPEKAVSILKEISEREGA